MLDTPKRLAAFLLNLERLDANGQHDAFVNEVLETFGRVDAPAGDRTHRWELDLQGICADGATAEEAIANWKRIARRHITPPDIEDDGFVTVHPDLTRMKRSPVIPRQPLPHAV
ncbi:hypothetical protein ETW23_05825 [Leisingera sp. NJS201]|uniref:hypothetical protein n=1 Tax=Leisingera sp. NJS201 TaxID=2508306 RepID=UPI0010707B53|nr:hypothetical protein [Leisingera sp. NJS201]QBR35730.1 hypothetical protein ETW23_05825 [Leisingera sp. NJS201]